MSRESYERPKGITFGVDRTFKEVAQPWLETGKRSLKASEAEFVCKLLRVCDELWATFNAEHRGLLRVVSEIQVHQNETQIRLARAVVDYAEILALKRKLFQ